VEPELFLSDSFSSGARFRFQIEKLCDSKTSKNRLNKSNIMGHFCVVELEPEPPEP